MSSRRFVMRGVPGQAPTPPPSSPTRRGGSKSARPLCAPLSASGRGAGGVGFFLILLLCCESVLADGKVFDPRDYKGSLEEQSQEAILIYTPGEEGEEATQ